MIKIQDLLGDLEGPLYPNGANDPIRTLLSPHMKQGKPEMLD